MNSVYIIGGSAGISGMFLQEGWAVVDSPEDADLLQFTGGADVSPMLYGEVRHPTTTNSPVRDDYECDMFLKFMDKPKVGICRGAQFITVMSGHKLYQDVNNHGISGTHDATIISSGETIPVTSTHHQMMRLGARRNWKVLLAAKLATYKQSGWVEKDITPHDFYQDLESVFYEDTNSLAYQPHPEYVSIGHPCRDTYFKFIKEQFNLGS